MSKRFTVSLIILAVVATLCVACEFVFAGIYGFGSVALPNATHDKYEITRMRIGVNSSVADGVSVHADVDFGSLDLKCANVGIKRGPFTLRAGKSLAPVQFSYASAQSIQLPDWPDAQKGFTAFGLGLRLDAARGPLEAHVAHFDDPDDGTRFAAQVSAIAIVDTTDYQRAVALSLYGEEAVGVGAVFEARVNRVFNPCAGGTSYDEASPRTAAFVKNYIEPFTGLRVHTQYDWSNDRDADDRWMLGATYEFAPLSFARLYYDTRLETLVPSVSFSFEL